MDAIPTSQARSRDGIISISLVPIACIQPDDSRLWFFVRFNIHQYHRFEVAPMHWENPLKGWGREAYRNRNFSKLTGEVAVRMGNHAANHPMATITPKIAPKSTT